MCVIRTAADLLAIALNYAAERKLVPFHPVRDVADPKGPTREPLLPDGW